MRRGADIIVNIDGDMQFNPADIAKLVQPLLKDEADFVTCSRFADPSLMPTMPGVKYWGNKVVTRIINWVCGGTNFSDVSCGFRAFNREAAYRMTLFGRFTYTQECFIDLFGKGLRISEVPLKVRGVREHGKSRIASSIWKYATNSLPIILRAMRDIQPLKFFGGIGAMFFMPRFDRRSGRDDSVYDRSREDGNRKRGKAHGAGASDLAFYQFDPGQRRSGDAGINPVRARPAGRHAGPSQANIGRAAVSDAPACLFQSADGRASLPPMPEELHLEHAESPESMGPTLHDSWSLPIMRSTPSEPAQTT